MGVPIFYTRVYTKILYPYTYFLYPIYPFFIPTKFGSMEK